jgi:hypothetical protein
MAKSVTRKQKRSNYSVRPGAAVNVVVAYLELPESVREVFMSFLAFYLISSDTGDSAGQYTTEEQSSQNLYELWIDWTQEIQWSSLTGYERREAVRVMFEVLSKKDDRGCFS